jgi:hypothetical protein
MSAYDPRRAGLDSLLDLDGYAAEVGGGFWVSMSANRVPQDAGRPDGIRYALTLHRPDGHRLLGYDNAHAISVSTGPGRRSSRPNAFDHVHRRERIIPYKFVSPGKLLEDFWTDVEMILKEEGAT